MRWLPRSLRSRITAAVVLLVTVVVGLAGLVIVVRIDHRDRTDVDRQLAARAEKGDQDADKLRDQGGHPSGDDGTGDDYGGLLAGSQSLVRLVSGGKVIAQHGETPTAPLPLPARDGYRTIDTDGQTWRSLTRSLSTGERLEVLQDIDPIERRLADNTAIVAAVTLLAALATAGGVWLLTRIILQPLERLRTGALAISADTAGPQLPAVTRPQEVADLSRALNGMLDQLRVSMDSTRRFTADAGHELRTPLTSIGVTLETLQRNPDLPAPQRARALEAMSAEHRRITALLTGLQTLARGDAHALPERAPVALAELLEAAVTHAAHRHPAITYRLTADSPATVHGWPVGLRLAVDNLLDNAALHGRPDGTVEVRLDRAADTVRITVGDDGPGIPADRQQAMKARFTRGARTRSPGSGLGLALVDQQAHLHHGTLHLAPGPTGGLEATLSLPSTPEDESGERPAPD
ncbi:HAMP domain-containing histidine kinase [Streptomyces sp. NBC_01478]|uniref:HAMP domain-containing sensor histidine kinase n=1 Tax=Streptomyces sp. NBC_01478 TaxID=2903882 RepID=UPI002E2F400B|nr:HAMP domain-containing sensor histidine kinase [Streptomyces sp. NBC_01478]